MTPEERVNALVACIVESLLIQFKGYEDDGIPGEILLVPLLNVVRLYGDKFNISLDRLKTALEAAGNNEGEVTTCTT